MMNAAPSMDSSSNHPKLQNISVAEEKQEETPDPEMSKLSIDDKQKHEDELIEEEENIDPNKSKPESTNNNTNDNEDEEDEEEEDDESSEDESDDDDDDDGNPMFAGLTEEQKEKMRAAMGGIKDGYNNHLDEARERLIKNTQEQVLFNLALKINDNEAEFIGKFCTENEINLSDKLQEEGSFFIDSMKEMIEQQSELNEVEANQEEEEDDDDDGGDEDWVLNEKKKKQNRKKQRDALNLPKNTNLNGSTRCGRLLLNDALKDVGSMDGWSDARKKAWKTRKTNPNSYFYRFNVPGQPQRNGKWSSPEHKLFMEQVKNVGVNIEWGTFSKKIPGRVGYQCSNYWRGLVKDDFVKDPNYKISINDNGSKKLHFKRNIPSFAISQEYRRYAITINKDKSGVFKPKTKHPKHPNADYMNKVKDEYDSVAPDKSNNKNNSKNKPKNNKNKRKRKKRSNGDSDDDDDYNPSTSKRRRRNKDESYHCSVDVESTENEDNPMPDFIDIMTGSAVVKPTISPFGHVLGYETWTKILRTMKIRNMCPFTMQKMTRRQLIKLDKNNYEDYKDKITNITKEQQDLLSSINA